jgi:hypothetical protein
VDYKKRFLLRKPEVDVVLGRRCPETATTVRFGLGLAAQSSNWDILSC